MPPGYAGAYGQGPSGPGGYGPGGYGGPVVPRRNGLAIAALILGLISIVGFITFVIPALALGLGLAAASKAKRSGGAVGGAGMARAGWILGALGVAGFVTIIVLVATGVIDTDEKSVDDLDIGSCYDLPIESDAETETISKLKEIDCDKPHDGQLVHEGQLNPDGDRPYVDDMQALTNEAGLECIDEPFTDFTGSAFDPAEFSIYVLVPPEETWDLTKGGYSCFLTSVSGDPLTQSYEDGA